MEFKIKPIICSLFCVSLLVQGCSMTTLKKDDALVVLETARIKAEEACWNAQKQTVYPDGMSEVAILSMEQQKTYKDIFGAVTGKHIGPCGGGTNLNDVLIAEVREKNETARTLGGKAIGGAMTLGGAKIAADMVTDISANSGHNTTTSIGGDDNSIGRDNNNLTNADGGSMNLTGDTTTTTDTTTVTTTTDMSEVNN